MKAAEKSNPLAAVVSSSPTAHSSQPADSSTPGVSHPINDDNSPGFNKIFKIKPPVKPWMYSLVISRLLCLLLGQVNLNLHHLRALWQKKNKWMKVMLRKVMSKMVSQLSLPLEEQKLTPEEKRKQE